MSVSEKNKRNSILLGQDNNALTWLIIINSVIFLVLIFVKLVYQMGSDSGTQAFQTQVADWLSLPAGGYKFLSRPWTLFTYMFTHESLWYLISSMLWLWCFGYILQDLAGNDKLFPIYLYGGIVGGAAFLISANLLPDVKPFAQSITQTGAAAPIMAVGIATTMLVPNYRIFQMLNGGIPLWIVTLIFVAVDFSTVGAVNSAVAVSHIASGLMGVLYIKQLKRGNDLGAWMVKFTDWLNDIFNPEKKASAIQLNYKPTRKPFEKKLHVTQQTLDDILDKIHQKGYHFLTDEEKEFLKKASNEEL